MVSPQPSTSEVQQRLLLRLPTEQAGAWSWVPPWFGTCNIHKAATCREPAQRVRYVPEADITERAEAYYSMGWEQECPLRAQLPISASVVWRYHVVVGGDVGIDRLVTDLEDAPDAAADRQRPAVILIGFPVGSDEWACRQVPALREIIIEEGLQRHGIDVGAVLISGKGPKV